jgi:hypothetical protein
MNFCLIMDGNTEIKELMRFIVDVQKYMHKHKVGWREAINVLVEEMRTYK